ncbi:unnamed protein product [Prunus armeniaca]
MTGGFEGLHNSVGKQAMACVHCWSSGGLAGSGLACARLAVEAWHARWARAVAGWCWSWRSLGLRMECGPGAGAVLCEVWAARAGVGPCARLGQRLLLFGANGPGAGRASVLDLVLGCVLTRL